MSGLWGYSSPNVIDAVNHPIAHNNTGNPIAPVITPAINCSLILSSFVVSGVGALQINQNFNGINKDKRPKQQSQKTHVDRVIEILASTIVNKPHA